MFPWPMSCMDGAHPEDEYQLVLENTMSTDLSQTEEAFLAPPNPSPPNPGDNYDADSAFRWQAEKTLADRLRRLRQSKLMEEMKELDEQMSPIQKELGELAIQGKLEELKEKEELNRKELKELKGMKNLKEELEELKLKRPKELEELKLNELREMVSLLAAGGKTKQTERMKERMEQMEPIELIMLVRRVRRVTRDNPYKNFEEIVFQEIELNQSDDDEPFDSPRDIHQDVASSASAQPEDGEPFENSNVNSPTEFIQVSDPPQSPPPETSDDDDGKRRDTVTETPRMIFSSHRLDEEDKE